MPYTIEELQRLIAPIARQHGVKSVALFGSYSRGTATADSDVDLLIEKGRIRSLYQLSGFRLDVEDALQLPVDVVTTEAADQEFVSMISKEKVSLYGQA